VLRAVARSTKHGVRAIAPALSSVANRGLCFRGPRCRPRVRAFPRQLARPPGAKSRCESRGPVGKMLAGGHGQQPGGFSVPVLLVSSEGAENLRDSARCCCCCPPSPPRSLASVCRGALPDAGQLREARVVWDLGRSHSQRNPGCIGQSKMPVPGVMAGGWRSRLLFRDRGPMARRARLAKGTRALGPEEEQTLPRSNHPRANVKNVSPNARRVQRSAELDERRTPRLPRGVGGVACLEVAAVWQTG